MKKVLALVLAVIMVCTMAMAVAVDTVTPATSGSTKVAGAYTEVTPGSSIYFTRDELNLTGTAAYLDKDNNFVPDKNTVSVTFEKGAELIASQGWVKEKTTNEYIYVLNTKESETATLDNVADIIIKSIKVTVYGVSAPALEATYVGIASDKAVGYSAQTKGHLAKANDSAIAANYFSLEMLKANPSAFAYMCFDYGYTADKIVVNQKDAKSTYSTPDRVVTVEKVKAADGKYYSTVDWSLNNTTPGDGLAMAALRTLKAGETMFFYTVDVPASSSAAEKALNKNLLTCEANIIGTLKGVVPNVSVQLVVEKAPKGAMMYMVNEDGTVKDLGAKFDANGILVATAKVTGPVIVTDKALTTTATTGTGSTTNPGTGANDVVGVAAALAVVALVSGAAISLKK